MEPALKQRMIGAIVLVALAVIFLPMLIKGPAPESGVADMPLDMPAEPKGEFETRELPLVTPAQAPEGGVVGLEPGDGSERLPTVDTTGANDANPSAAGDDAAALLPAATAGGDYAVSFGTYGSSADADRVLQALSKAGLPGYQDTVSGRDDRTLHRVRIGPYATRAEAEAARLAATAVRDDIDVKVVTLNADAAELAEPAAPAASTAREPDVRQEPLPESRPAASTAAPAAAAPQPVAAKPVATQQPATQAPAPPKPAAPAAADIGFAVQLGAFSHAEEATKLRDRARAAGFSAFVESVNTDKGTLSRVRVGPVGTRGEAEQLKSQVAAKLGIDGIVRPHP